MHTERAWPQRSRCFVSSIVVLLSQRTQRLLGAYLDSISQAALTPPLILNASCLAPSPATILVPALARERLQPRPGEFPHITSRAPSQPDVTLPQALLLFALPLPSRNRLPKRAMAPRNATTPLSPLSPDSDQAPGLSRTPSFLEFTPQARHGLIVWCGRGERPVELQDQWECLEHGSRGSLGVGGLAFAIPSGVNPILRMT
ncbi:hypothetical protein AcV7_002772 [Taiwanofungus camphoratus]|nr:hypothetical protein AcV7_002772 [Antrodia cinnamomea]